MSDATAFHWVEIEGFRGFNGRQHIELDASAVIVVGPNGTGKTSFFDAIQWLLLGSLKRLEKLRVRKNDEHIVNRYRGSDPAVVEAELDIRGSRIHLRRQGRYDSGLLEWHANDESVHGAEAERRLKQALTARPGQDVRRLLMTSALLQQDVVREVLEDKPAERYQHLATLLGLDELGEFDVEVGRRAGRLATAGTSARQELQTAEERVEQLERRIANMEQDIQLSAEVRSAQQDILARVAQVEPIVRLATIPASSAEAALAHRAAETTGKQLTELLRTARDLEQQRSTLSLPAEEEVATRRQLLTAAEQKVQEAEQTASRAEEQLDEATARSSSLAALAVQARELLGPTCPVCGQDIEEHDVRHRLGQVVDGAEDADLRRSLEAAEAARARLAEARARAARERADFAPLDAALKQAHHLQKSKQDWKGQVEAFAVPEGASISVTELAAIQAGDVGAIARGVDALRVLCTAVGDLIAVLRTGSNEALLTDLRSQVRRARDGIARLRDAAQLASRQEESGKVLQRAATRAVTAVTEKRFKRLAPTVQDIYWRLDPHPSFTTLDFDLNVYRSRGIASPVVRDVSESIEADPLLVFSSSQANVTALAYFLALGWAAGHEALPFVLLDDPLQSMDDVNTLGFADLCRHIRRKRQLVVSTHERRLGSLLSRKLAPRVATERTRLVEFKAWTRDGPEIDQTLVEPQVSEGEQRSILRLNAA